MLEHKDEGGRHSARIKKDRGGRRQFTHKEDSDYSTRTDNMEEGGGDSVGIMNVEEETVARMENMKEGVDSVRTDKIEEGGDSAE